MVKNFCPNCGAATTGTNFCPNCGHSLTSATQTHQHHTQKPTSGNFTYPTNGRFSKVISNDQASGEPVVTFRKLHPNAILLFYFQYLGRSAILLLLFIIAAYFEPIIASVIIIAYLFILFLVAYTNYKSYYYEVSTVAFRKEYGIFHKYSVNIAFDQIQNINMRRSIIDQILGLAHLEIETAGTGGEVKRNIGGLMTTSEGYIPGIDLNEARDIKALILARIDKE